MNGDDSEIDSERRLRLPSFPFAQHDRFLQHGRRFLEEIFVSQRRRGVVQHRRVRLGLLAVNGFGYFRGLLKKFHSFRFASFLYILEWKTNQNCVENPFGTNNLIVSHPTPRHQHLHKQPTVHNFHGRTCPLIRFAIILTDTFIAFNLISI